MNFVQYDNDVILPIKILFNNVPFDLTGSTVLITIKLPNLKDIISKDGIIVNAKTGEVEVILKSADLYYSGNYYYQATVITPTGLEFSNNSQQFNVSSKLDGNLLGVPTYDIPANLKGPKGDPGPQGPPGDSVDFSLINEQFQVVENKIKEVAESIGTGGGGTIPSNVILFDDWVPGESVTIDTGTTPPTDTTPPIVTINPVGGTYTTTKTITLTTNETADIFYTIDGTTPTIASTKYTGPITVESTKTIKYFAKDTVGNVSVVQTALFTINIDTTAPILTITTGGTFTGTKTVTMSANETADIFYTLDGSGPTTSSNKYTTPLTINTTTTLKAFAKDTAGNVSAIQTVVYTLDVTPPADTTPPENVTGLSVSNKTQTGLTLSWVASVSSDTASYDILNGSTVVANVTGTTYNVIGLVANTSYTFTIKAKDASNNISSGASISATTLAIADTTPPTLTITPMSGTFSTTQTVTMSVNETATIYYTTDGITEPNTSSFIYTIPLILSETTIIKAIAKDTAGNVSVVQTFTYTKETAPVTGNFVTDGLQIYYDFKRLTSTPTTIEDSSGKGNNGSLKGYAGTGTSGVTNNELISDGTGDYIFIPHNTVLKTYPITLEFYISPFNRTGNPPPSPTLFDCQLGSGTGNGFRIYFNNGSHTTLPNTLAFSGSLGQPPATTVPLTAFDGQYRHIVVVMGATNQKIYVDGVLVLNNNATSTNISTSTRDLFLFVAGNGLNDTLANKSKMFRFYNKELTLAEINQNYNDAKS